jgi:hypothetical protein
VGSKEPAFESELIQQLKTLLADYPDLSKWLINKTPKVQAHYWLIISLQLFLPIPTMFQNSIRLSSARNR